MEKATPSLAWFAILLILVSMLFQYSESCPPGSLFNFSCPDNNVYNGPLSTSHFTDDDYNCGGPCELTCDADHTMIKCTHYNAEPAYRVLEINPTNLTITMAADYPDRWMSKLLPSEVYSNLNFSFPNFKSVSLSITGSGENQTFLGCPFPSGEIEYHDYWDPNFSGLRDGRHNIIVYGPYEHDQLPPGKPLPPAGCMKFQTYFSVQGEPASNSIEHSLKRKDAGVLAHALNIDLLATGILVGLVIGLITGICYNLKTKKPSANFEAFLRTYRSSAPQRYTYLDIKKMTSCFKEKVGQGGFGTVYKGMLEDGRLVAVKVLNPSKGDNEKEFINEVASIGRTNHINIVTFLGFCFQRRRRALVYEFMPNGSLDKFTKAKDHIRYNVSKSLAWRTMFEISLGIARG